MAKLVLVIDSNESIDQLNARVQRSGNPHEAIQNVINLLDGAEGGAYPCAVQVTVRDSDPSVSTSGTDSSQESYSLGK